MSDNPEKEVAKNMPSTSNVKEFETEDVIRTIKKKVDEDELKENKYESDLRELLDVGDLKSEQSHEDKQEDNSKVEVEVKVEKMLNEDETEQLLIEYEPKKTPDVEEGSSEEDSDTEEATNSEVDLEVKSRLTRHGNIEIKEEIISDYDIEEADDTIGENRKRRHSSGVESSSEAVETKKKRPWNHNLEKRRQGGGEYHRLCMELSQNEERYYKYFHMSHEAFEQLHEKLSPSITKMFSNYRTPITSRERLVVCLRYLASGLSYGTVANSFQLGRSTVSKIVRETCTEIWNILQPEYMPEPTRKIYEESERGFSDIYNFPNCVGCIDGKHVSIKSPKKDREHKKESRIVLLSIIDPWCKFTAIDIGDYGYPSETGIFEETDFYHLYVESLRKVVPSKTLPGTTSIVPRIFIGDETFTLQTFLLRPYPVSSTRVDEKKKKFNERLREPRSVVKEAFDMLIKNWKIFARPLETDFDTASNVIKAACCLHNYIIKQGGEEDESGDWSEESPPKKKGKRKKPKMTFTAHKRSNRRWTIEAGRIREMFVKLKRRLVEDTTPLPKRLCLAKNVINSHHFPTAAKERLVAEWLQDLVEENKLSAEELRDVIGWLSVDNLTRDLKVQLAQVVSKYLQKNPIQKEDVQKILPVVENDIHVHEYLYINITLLQYLRSEENSNFSLSNKILNNVINYYKDSKKKYEFIIKLLDGNNIETIFDYLDTEIRDTVKVLCENVLFPFNKKSFFVTLLKTYIRTDNIDDLIAEKGDNIQSVLKIMDVFFSFPKGRSDDNPKFLIDYIDMFVSCYKKESQLIFAFYIMISNVLGMEQNYIVPTTSLNQINLQEKVKRNIFLKMLEILLKNEVDIDVRLTDTFGEKISKVETKKTFLLLLQAIMMGQIKLEGKPDETTIKIINVALKLDPTLVENKIDEILPPIMTAKKNDVSIKEAYIEMLNCLLDILFKLSRGIPFLNKILPLLKINLETNNTEQAELKIKIKALEEDTKDFAKVKSKIIKWSDIFPEECVEMYGKLTSELMFRQNKELLLLLQKDFEEYCLAQLQQDSLDPSTITLTELLTAILSTFLRYSKMADHTVPLSIAKEFWASYDNFENVCLKSFGDCVIKNKYEPTLMLPFLKLCLSFAQLKLLNITYGNTELTLPEVGNLDVFDLSILLPFFSGEQWVEIGNSVKDAESINLLDKLLLTKIKAIEIQSDTLNDENIVTAKMHLLKQISTHPQNLTTSGNYLTNILFYNLDKNLLKLLSKSLLKLYLSNPEENIFNDTIVYNRDLLNALVIQTCRHMTENLENVPELAKGLKKLDFDLGEFAKGKNMKQYFENITVIDDSTMNNCLDILKELKIYYLEEKFQLVAIFVLLAVKRCGRKKIRKNVDSILHNIFELSTQAPDIYKIFPIEYIFSFEDRAVLNLLTLKNKTTDNSVIIKSILESAVKRVRSESELVIKIVELLLKNHNSNKATSIDYFSDTTFQISCIILPLIAKQKKVLTSSAYRSILADLQEKLHKSTLDAFKKINFKDNGSLVNSTGNTDDSMVVSNDMAILNAMAAYSLTLSKYCETTDGEEIKNLDCLWSGLEYFVHNAIQSIQKPDTKPQQLETSIQLLNITLRHYKKLESHYIFETKNKILLQIWQSLKSRLSMVFESGGKGGLEDIGVTVKFLCELSDVDSFNSFVGDLTGLMALEEPKLGMKKKEDIHKIPNSLKVAQYLWSYCLKANVTGPKCVAITKSIYQSCRNANNYVWQHYRNYQYGVVIKRKKKKIDVELKEDEDISIVRVDDYTCELFKLYLDILAEAILAAKKISIDYKFLDSIFELQQHLQVILGLNTTSVRCEVTCSSFFRLCQGSIAILNNLLVAREEHLEDRWPCYMQCYRALVRCLCERAIEQTERTIEEKLAETAHNIEKIQMLTNDTKISCGSDGRNVLQDMELLTQSISKRKVHISRIAVYTVADICNIIERTAPPRILRQHIENSVSMLIQASDTAYSVAFLRRALAGVPGQMTMTNLYTMYKRYHKYVGNA